MEPLLVGAARACRLCHCLVQWLCLHQSTLTKRLDHCFIPMPLFAHGVSHRSFKQQLDWASLRDARDAFCQILSEFPVNHALLSSWPSQLVIWPKSFWGHMISHGISHISGMGQARDASFLRHGKMDVMMHYLKPGLKSGLLGKKTSRGGHPSRPI